MSDRETGFKQGTEASAKLADKLARGVLSGTVLPSCQSPNLVSQVFVILAEEIRKLQPKT